MFKREMKNLSNCVGYELVEMKEKYMMKAIQEVRLVKAKYDAGKDMSKYDPEYLESVLSVSPIPKISFETTSDGRSFLCLE